MRRRNTVSDALPGTASFSFAQVALNSVGFASTDANGFFRLSNVPLASYRLTSFDPVTGIGAASMDEVAFENGAMGFEPVHQQLLEQLGLVAVDDHEATGKRTGRQGHGAGVIGGCRGQDSCWGARFKGHPNRGINQHIIFKPGRPMGRVCFSTEVEA